MSADGKVTTEGVSTIRVFKFVAFVLILAGVLLSIAYDSVDVAIFLLLLHWYGEWRERK